MVLPALVKLLPKVSLKRDRGMSPTAESKLTSEGEAGAC